MNYNQFPSAVPGMQNIPMYNPQPNQYDRMAQLQQYNQGLQQNFPPMQNTVPQQQMVQPTTALNGKVVQTVENITANDVPMDGSIALFPRQDMTEIYAKAWQSDGTIRTVVYKAVLEQQPNNTTQEMKNVEYENFNKVLEGISEKIDSVSSRLDEFMSKPKTRVKREVDVE